MGTEVVVERKRPVLSIYNTWCITPGVQREQMMETTILVLLLAGMVVLAVLAVLVGGCP
jgi:hypothetical protein